MRGSNASGIMTKVGELDGGSGNSSVTLPTIGLVYIWLFHFTQQFNGPGD